MKSGGQAGKILIIGPAWVGDMIMAQCLFKLLKQQNPETILDVLAPAWTFSLLQRMPEVSSAIELPFQHGELKLTQRFKLAKKLRAHRYDQAIVLPNSFKSALIPWFAGIPKRSGWLGECRYVVLNDYRYLDRKRYPLMIQQYIALGLKPEEALPAHIPYPEFQVTAALQQTVLAKHKPLWRGKPILAVCAGAEFGPAKRWPEEYFAQVANEKIKQGWDIWLFGSPKDKPVTDKIMQLTQHQCENISGRTELAETIVLLSLVSGVVTNDSGLMHMAAALKKPLVALYGSTSPHFTPPLADDAHILKLDLACQPCFQRVCPLQHYQCMRDLLPQQVLQIINQWKVT
jgi:lipopolysaccharide heptosyltransferase II